MLNFGRGISLFFSIPNFRRRWPAVSSWRINRRCSIFLVVSIRSSTRTWTWHRFTTSKAVQRLIPKIQQLSETDYWNYCIKNKHQNLSKCKMTHSLTMQHAILSFNTLTRWQLAVGESSSTNARWIWSNQWHWTANVWRNPAKHRGCIKPLVKVG